MAQIVIADEAGACYGVERALELVLSASENVEGPLHTLGPLIHNPLVVRDLERRGVTVVEDAQEVEPGSTLVLRTHGVTPKVKEEGARRPVPRARRHLPLCEAVASRGRAPRARWLSGADRGRGGPSRGGGHARPRPRGDRGRVSPRGSRIGLSQGGRRGADHAGPGQAPRAMLCPAWDATTSCASSTPSARRPAGHQEACAELAAKADVMVVVGARTPPTPPISPRSARGCRRRITSRRDDELEPAWFAARAHWHHGGRLDPGAHRGGAPAPSSAWLEV